MFGPRFLSSRPFQAKPERPFLNLCSFSYQPNINSALHFMVAQVSNQSAVPHRFINWSYPINSVVIRAKRWSSKSQLLKQTGIVTSPPGNMQLQYPARVGGHSCLFLSGKSLPFYVLQPCGGKSPPLYHGFSC
jgi:hypothetical protein